MTFLRAAVTGSIVVLALYLLTGCGVTEQVRSSYNETQNITTYKLKGVPLGKFGGVSGIHEANIDMFTEAQCRGRDCQPKKVELHFRFAKTAGQQGNTMTFRTEKLWIQADEIRITWDDPFQQLVDRTVVARGEVGSVECTLEELAIIARAENVEGRFGGMEFSMRHSGRAPLRAFLEQIESDPSSNATARSTDDASSDM
jgi:hypothetical protein